MKLTQRQERFCLHYFQYSNATEAALQAGYSKKIARFVGSENLTKPNIKNRLLELHEKKNLTEDAAIASVEERQKILTEIARGRFIDFIGDVSDEQLQSAALQEIKKRSFIDKFGRPHEDTTVRLHNPMQAIDIMNKMDRIYLEGPTVNIDNRRVEIIVESPETKAITERLLHGELPGEPSPGEASDNTDI